MAKCKQDVQQPTFGAYFVIENILCNMDQRTELEILYRMTFGALLLAILFRVINWLWILRSHFFFQNEASQTTACIG